MNNGSGTEMGLSALSD